MRLIDADELKKQIKYTGENDTYIFMNIAIESAIDKAPTIETTKTIFVDDVDWIGGMLKKYRKMKGLTQRDLARRMGVSPAAICQYEKGHRNLTRIPTLKRLADALGISISDFFIGYEEFEEENTENGRAEDAKRTSSEQKQNEICERTIAFVEQIEKQGNYYTEGIKELNDMFKVEV